MNTPGGAQRLNVLSEAGLYKLILRSDKPEAKRFQDWVTSDVLPAICMQGPLDRTSAGLSVGRGGCLRLACRPDR